MDELLENAPPEAPSEYSPEIGQALMTIMGQGYSLTAAAGEIGLSREMVEKWRALSPDLEIAIQRGNAMRTRKLECDFLTAPNAAFVQSRRIALLNAAPADWHARPSAPSNEEQESPLTMLAKELMGTALRPKE
jgi:hypothetical protein